MSGCTHPGAREETVYSDGCLIHRVICTSCGTVLSERQI